MINNVRIQKLISAFKSEDYYQSHKDITEILKSLVLDNVFLFEIIRYNLSKPDFLRRKRHYPTLSMVIAENENFSFVANLWLPLPNKETDTSFQSIHHHGNLLLSTISAYGPGYNSILFKKGFKIYKETEETEMVVDKIYHNSLNHLEFIDANTPHVVFYPTDFSITYALWSADKPMKAKAALKKMGILKAIKKPLLQLLKIFRLDSLLGLNTVTYFDFHPSGGKLKAMKDRVGYPEGSNGNFLQNIFYILQKVGFDDRQFLESLKKDPKITRDAHTWIDKFLKGEEINPKFEDIHLNVPKVNLLKKDILAVVKN
jgi:hypothetical protein